MLWICNDLSEESLMRDYVEIIKELDKLGIDKDNIHIDWKIDAINSLIRDNFMLYNYINKSIYKAKYKEVLWNLLKRYYLYLLKENMHHLIEKENSIYNKLKEDVNQSILDAIKDGVKEIVFSKDYLEVIMSMDLGFSYYLAIPVYEKRIDDNLEVRLYVDFQVKE